MIPKRNLRIALGAGLAIVLYSTLVFVFLGDFASLSQEQLRLAETLGFLRYIILAVAILVVLWAHDKSQSGKPGFWSLVGEGVLVGLVIALLVGLMEAIYMSLNPDFSQQYGQLYLERMQAEGATAAELLAAHQEMADFEFLMTPGGMGIFYFFETAILGAVFALLIAGFVAWRKKRKQDLQPG